MEAAVYDDVIRTPQEVARRAVALFASVGAALGADRNEVLSWLSENDLDGDLTPTERRFLDNPSPSQSEKIVRSWDAERLIILLWALKRVPSVPRDDEQCDTSVFQDHLPPFSGEGIETFIANAQLRTTGEIMAMAEHCLRVHWRARDAKIRRCPPEIPVDIEVIQERHHAINWVTGYDGGVPWDEVTTDT